MKWTKQLESSVLDIGGVLRLRVSTRVNDGGIYYAWEVCNSSLHPLAEGDDRDENAAKAAALGAAQIALNDAMLDLANGRGVQCLIIRDDALFWQMKELEDRGDGWIAQLLGLDILTVRGMYADYCAREGTPTAARQRSIIAGFSPEQQERFRKERPELYEGRE